MSSEEVEKVAEDSASVVVVETDTTIAAPAECSEDLSSQTTSASCPFIEEDIQFIRDNVPKAAILTLNKEFITVVIMLVPLS